MSLAFVFPGQGSQAPGMGRDLADAFPIARHTFQEVDDALSQRLSRLIFEGPAEELTLTANAQPALMAVSLAVVRVLATEAGFDLGRRVALVAGHSLGEYSALTAAGSFDLPTAARLLRVRGDAMQQAVAPGEGAMAALLGAEAEQARAICAEAAQGEVVEVANDNGGGQVVISGAKAAVERAIEAAKAAGIKRAMLLPVSAPFHCAMMAPAAEVMADALSKARMVHPAVPVVANVTAAPVSDPEAIRELLVRQVTGTVRWRECVAAMAAAGCTRFVEIGAGKVLTGLMKRNAPEASAMAVSTPADIEAFAKTL
ncbi:ACP S-malonyltransferase [Roseococcus suduntuyensis]|uniref:Malonyl CoA-acyl carrier protein transacylase n=1 Tax=Roseococcus suduntuyensis TaxID=455361 RepID=A0A840ABX0_9PROT|nr:ACP S-malonyltransferase [Roseococcus suduntuyensis]MBB3897635.1 [acyl-carrier-protein] S-malonyltransferase [Roseococcus suduntuyensis]